MPRYLTLILTGLLLTAVLGLGIRFLPEDLATEVDVQALPPPPAATDLSPAATRVLLADRTQVIDGEAGSFLDGGGYVSVTAAFASGAKLAPLLLEIFSDKVRTIVLSAALTFDDGRSLPAVPVLILSRIAEREEGTPAPSQAASSQPENIRFTDAFTVGEGARLTPLVSMDDVSRVTVSLSTDFFNDDGIVFSGGLTGETESLVAAFAADPPPVWAPDGTYSAAARALETRLAAKRIKHVDSLIEVILDLAEDGSGSTRTVRFLDPNGTPVSEVTFGVSGHAARLAGMTDLTAIMETALGSDRNIASVLTQNGQAVTDLLTSEAASLPDSCTRAGDGLRAAGVGRHDRAAVLAALEPVRSLFAPTGSCSGKTDTPPATGTVSIDRRNDVLQAVSGLLRFGASDQALAALEQHFADRVALFDHSRLWLTGLKAPAVEGEAAIVRPTASAPEAMELTGMLPARHAACFFTPRTGHGNSRRAALVELQHAPGLWVMDAAFDTQGRATGLSLSAATQADVCRAVGKGGSCYFVRAGRAFGTVDPGKC